MMKKEIYEEPQIQMLIFESEDVITTSGFEVDGGEDGGIEDTSL